MEHLDDGRSVRTSAGLEVYPNLIVGAVGGASTTTWGFPRRWGAHCHITCTFWSRARGPSATPMRENLAWRDERPPDLWLYPCVGSIFQKIEGIGAGRLIDECGLKGYVHGRAGIFHKHANIIVNFGGATAEEVRWLIDLARETVLRETGHELTSEITFVGEF